MRLQVGKWVVKPDSGGIGWVVGEPFNYMKKTKGGGEEPAEGIKDPRYPSTLQGALKMLLDRSLRESECRTLRDVSRHIDAFRAEVDDVFAIDRPAAEAEETVEA